MNDCQRDTLREICKTYAMAYKSIGDYTYASDGFCDMCPYSALHDGASEDSYKNDGKIIEFVRLAVVEKLKRDGYEICEWFDENTGKELEHARTTKTEVQSVWGDWEE